MEKENTNEFPQETIVSIAEATDFLDFLNRRKLTSHDHRGKHYESKKWKYLSAKEILMQGKSFQFKVKEYPYSRRIIGNNIFSANLDEFYLTLCHISNHGSISKGDEERFDHFQKDYSRHTDGIPRYERGKYLDWGQFWPFHSKFGNPDDFRAYVKNDLDSPRTRRFKVMEKQGRADGGAKVFLDKEELLEYFNTQFGTDNLVEILQKEGVKSESEASIIIDEFSKKERRFKKSGLVPLALTIQYNGCLSLVKPKESDWMYLQYDIEGGIEKALIEEEVQPKDLGNGVIVMNEDRIPKYLQRTLGLGNKK